MKPSLRFEVFKRDSFTCRYCGKKSPEAILEVDHVVPRKEGGTDDLENLVTSCSDCNRGKGASLLTEIPGEGDLHEKAILLKERELQLREFNYWTAERRQREDDELDYLENEWQRQYRSEYFFRSSVRTFIRKIGLDGCRDALEITRERMAGGAKQRSADAFRYFCKVCWNKAEGRDHRQRD